MTNRKPSILILCTGNSCRSQMAEGWIRHYVNDKVDVKSAGLEPSGVHPLAIRVMAEKSIDISGHTSNHLNEFKEQSFDYVLTVCDHAREQCPVFPGNATSIHKNFRDPAELEGDSKKVLDTFREVRDQIGRFANRFLEKNVNISTNSS